MEPFDFYDTINDIPEQFPYKIDFINNSDDDENNDEFLNYFSQYIYPTNYEIKTKDDDLPPDKSIPNIPQYTCHSVFLERIKNEFNLTKEEFEAFIRYLNHKKKDKKSGFERNVTTHHKSGTIERSISCCRRFISLSDDAWFFKEAFYYFTYGSHFKKKFVKILHNNICDTLQIKPISRDQFRSIRYYFEMFKNSCLEITFLARKYCIEHPEFIAQITESK